jgi:hypothetical protein
VRWYWIVDPEARTLEAFALIENGWLDAGSFDETDVARIAPFQAVEMPSRSAPRGKASPDAITMLSPDKPLFESQRRAG